MKLRLLSVSVGNEWPTMLKAFALNKQSTEGEKEGEQLFDSENFQ